MVALNSSNLDTLPSPITTLAKAIEAISILDRNTGRLNNAALGRDSLFFEVMKKSANFELDLTKQNNLLVLAESASALTFTLTEVSKSRPGMSVIFYDYTNNSETYNITVARNGNTINGTTNNITIAKNGGFVWLLCTEEGKWIYIDSDLTPILYSKFNPVGANAAWATAYSAFSAIFGASILACASGVFGGGFYGLGYRGTVATPTATQSGDLLAHMRGMGYDGSAFKTVATLQMTATETFIAGTNQGAETSLRVTPNGTTSLATVATFKQDKTTEFRGGIRFNTNNTYDMFTASIAPSNTYGVNAFTTISDIRLKQLIEIFALNDELLDKLIEAECFISWVWKDFENQELFEYEKQIITDPETKEEREITVPVLVQSHYRSNHKRRHCGSNAFKVIKVLLSMDITLEDFPIVSIENYKPKMIDLIRNMTEEEFRNTPESVIGRLSIRNELYMPLMANAIYRQKRKLTSLESRVKVIENSLTERFGP